MTSAADPVSQACAWLTAQTGQPVPLAEEAPVRGAFVTPAPKATSAGVRSDPTDPGRRRPDAGNPDRRGADVGDPDEEADPESVARTIALRKLAAQARTRHELDQALRKKKVPDEAAAAVLDRLEEVGLVDDQAFAQDWVASRQQRRHLSKTALRRELQAKGVDRDHLDEALATIDTDDELAAAQALATKKAAAMRGLEPMVRDRRLAGALARRGFGSGIISTVLSELRQGDL